uniref:Uncharacterized protein n=1 Tax=Oryza brachyantha TaxID=4533 RepID=J3M9F5_ORYBR
MVKDSAMEEHSLGSGDAMNIFGQSIDVRRPSKSRRRVTHKNLSPEIEDSGGSSSHRSHRRQAIAAHQERARAESELSMAMNMAMELERQIEQNNAKARPHSVKAELRRLQREVKAAAAEKGAAGRDAEASTTSRVRSSPRDVDGVGIEADGASDEHGVLVELAVGLAATTTPTKELRRDTSCASDLGATRATASSDAGLRHAELALVEATGKCHANDVGGSSEVTAITTRRQVEHEIISLPEAEAELSSARIELESIKAEGRRFRTSIERTREETARVTDEIRRLTEQEKKASAQVQQLNAKLIKARSRLESVTSAEERAEEVISKLTAILRQLDDDTEAAEKEKTLTAMESRAVRADLENVEAEIAAAEQRIRESVRELEVARASEAAATAKLKAIVASATLATVAAMPQSSSGNVTIPRFEYEYLTGRAEVLRAVAEKKAAAAEAWAEARRASEKEITMRAEAIERELREARAGDAQATEDGQDAAARQEPRDHTSRRPAEARGRGAATTSARTKSQRMPSSSSPAARKPRSPPYSVKRRKKRVLTPNCLKLFGGKCRGLN